MNKFMSNSRLNKIKQLGFCKNRVLLIELRLNMNMKKVRISKKDPTKNLKTFQVQPSSRYQHRRDLTNHSPQFKVSQNIVKQELKNSARNTHRYHIEEPQPRRTHYKKYSLSPRQERVSFNRDKNQRLQSSLRTSNQLHKLKYRSPSQRSPYLQRKNQNRSDHKLILGNNKSQHKIYRPIRLNSLEHRMSSEKDQTDKRSHQVLRQAKKLMQLGQIRKSIYILKGILKTDPNNLDALYVGMMNWYNAEEYEKCLVYLHKLYQLKPTFSCDLYVVWSQILVKQKQYDLALQKLKQGTKYFPKQYRTPYEIGKIYLDAKNYAIAINYFQECLAICPNSQEARQKLLLAYSSINQLQKVLKTVSQLLKVSNNAHKILMYKEIQAETLIKLKKFKELIRKLNGTQQQSLLYYLGISYFYLKDYLKSYLILESTLQTQNKNEAVKFMLIIKIRQNDFYEAMHLLSRCTHLNIPSYHLQIESFFIEGVICLMRRHILEGIQKLQYVCQAQDNGMPQNQFTNEVFPIVHCYIAYGLYCLGFYERCWEHYEVQKKKYPYISFQGFQYNSLMVKAYLSYKEDKIQEAQDGFMEIILKNGKRLEPIFCLAICQARLGTKFRQNDNNQCQIHYKNGLKYLNEAVQLVQKIQNNSSSNIFYHKSLIHAFLEQWREAIICIDQAIERSEQNDWKHFYVRSLIMASIHNFSQAINDSTVAINLRPTEPDPYFIRSSCFQIQGQGNNAFRDLQTYITLRPNDDEIHKFAGKLLFENGAFEDAIIAFEHSFIEKDIKNVDTFLTKSKTFFLLGQFHEASRIMEIVYELDPKPAFLFDSKMMEIVGQIVQNHDKNSKIVQKLERQYNNQAQNYSKQQIFKKTQLNTLKSLCLFYKKQYEAAIHQLAQAIKVKKKTIMKETLIQGNARQDQKDTKVFCSQMKFNMAVCYLMLGDQKRALEQAQKMQIKQQEVYYENYCSFISILSGRCIPGKQIEVKILQVFPNRNKISNFIPQIDVTINKIEYRIKLCIPFPKVEPPQIFPQFNSKLLEFDIRNVDRKPEAPWIHKQQNTVNFTGKIQKYSRLEIQQSHKGGSSASLIQSDSSHLSICSVSTRRNHLNTKQARRVIRNRVSS